MSSGHRGRRSITRAEIVGQIRKIVREDQSKLVVANEIGVKTKSPQEAVDVNGNVKATAFLTRSSLRYKENVQLINDPLDKVMHIRGVHFDWKDTKKKDVGVIAEEVGQVLPELVKFEPNGIDAELLDYPKLTALLIECVKELKKEIEDLKFQIKTII